MAKVNNIEIKLAKSKGDLEKVFRMRRVIFVEEQNVSKNIERDRFDRLSKHFIALYKSRPVGCARIRLAGKKAKLERIAVMKKYRGKGFGKLIVEYLIDYCKNEGTCDIFMNAKYYLKNYYAKLGFKPKGKIFMEAGIKHIKMHLN